MHRGTHRSPFSVMERGAWWSSWETCSHNGPLGRDSPNPSPILPRQWKRACQSQQGTLRSPRWACVALGFRIQYPHPHQPRLNLIKTFLQTEIHVCTCVRAAHFLWGQTCMHFAKFSEYRLYVTFFFVLNSIWLEEKDHKEYKWTHGFVFTSHRPSFVHKKRLHFKNIFIFSFY